MQKETSLSPAMPSPSTIAPGGGRQASMSLVPNKKDAGRSTFPKARRKPSISKVILKTIADKGEHHHVSLAALKKAMAHMGYNMARVSGRFKRVLRRLVDEGMLKRVTGKGVSGSFRIGKKKASKTKLKVKTKQQQPQRRTGQRKLILGSRKGQKRLRVRRIRGHRRHN